MATNDPIYMIEHAKWIRNISANSYLTRLELMGEISTPLVLGGALIKSSKILYCLFVFFHLGSLGIYVDKMVPNFHLKKMTRSAPSGVRTIIYPRFVSDWTGDSHLTHYLPSKTMDFWFRPKLLSVYIHDIYLPMQL